VDRGTGGQRDDSEGPVDRHGGGAEMGLDLVFGVPVGGVDEEILGGLLALEVVLGQCRSLVGAIGFVADQRDGAFVALFAQRFDRLGRGESGSDDDDSG